MDPKKTGNIEDASTKPGMFISVNSTSLFLPMQPPTKYFIRIETKSAKTATKTKTKITQDYMFVSLIHCGLVIAT